MKNAIGFILLIWAGLVAVTGCTAQTKPASERIVVGAERTNLYFPDLKGKNIAIVANQTSLIGKVHLVDSLVRSGLNVKRVFGPEHGFRGGEANGADIGNDTDRMTGIPVISLYGKKKKPTAEDLDGIDLVIYDIQDVGVRFYTYISTMTYVMEACAENDIPLIVLDRPDPNGDYIDGPVLEKEFSSFIGLHPVPVVYGMTVGEYAAMVNDEGWLTGGIHCILKVIPCANYDHTKHFDLPVPPSPNLPNSLSVQLYPSLCFFEGTIISVGRGTDFPFQVIGHPDYSPGSYAFTPHAIPGVAVQPKYEGKQCYGISLSSMKEQIMNERWIHLNWLIEMYRFFNDRNDFFTPYFSKLAGTDQLQKQIMNGVSEEQIRSSWQPRLETFKQIRKKYLLYRDFE